MSRNVNEQIENIEIDGKYYFIDFDFSVCFEHDYGADADGNRGRTVYYAEDVMISSIQVSDEEYGDCEDVDMENKNNEEIVNKLHDVAEEYADKCDLQNVYADSFDV